MTLRSFLWAIGAIAILVGGGLLCSLDRISPATSIPIFMLVIMVVAWRAGFRASIVTAIVATLSLDFFFIEPYYSLRIASPRDIFMILIFAATSTLVSQLSLRIQAKSDLLHQAEEQQRLLYELSRSAILLDWRGDVEVQLCNLIQERFRLERVALWSERERHVTAAGKGGETDADLEATFRAQRNCDLPDRQESLRILRFGTRPIGVLLLRGKFDPEVADATATLAATHLERVRSLKSEVSAQSQAVSERLRAAVLDGLAHAVKTPLTTIIVSSSGLREVGSLTPLQAELVDVIENQASHLVDVTNKLLRTASLESHNIQIHPQSVCMDEVFSFVLSDLSAGHDIARIHVEGIPKKSFEADPELLRMALLQVLENALKYSPASSPVRICFSQTNEEFRFSVHNQGSYIPAHEHGLIFDRYYRGTSTARKANGTGIGLSVAEHAVEAHGGRIWVESDTETGMTFHISLPTTLQGEENASRVPTDRRG